MTETETTPETEANPDAPPAEEKKKIKQTVDIQDVGPCKKHIKVTVGRDDIDASFQKKFKELVGESDISLVLLREGAAARSSSFVKNFG